MRSWLTLCIGLIIAPGCGTKGPATYPVTGTVTYKNAPVTSGVVRFNPADAKQKDVHSAEGKIGSDGKFSLSTFQSGDGALPGEYTVTVLSMPTLDPNVPAKDQAKNLKSAVPEKYGDPKSSGLKATVKTGEGAKDLKFDLTD